MGPQCLGLKLCALINFTIAQHQSKNTIGNTHSQRVCKIIVDVSTHYVWAFQLKSTAGRIPVSRVIWRAAWSKIRRGSYIVRYRQFPFSSIAIVMRILYRDISRGVISPKLIGRSSRLFSQLEVGRDRRCREPAYARVGLGFQMTASSMLKRDILCVQKLIIHCKKETTSFWTNLK